MEPNKVLLAEDDKTMLQLLKALLEIEGFQVICLPSPAVNLLELLSEEMPNYLLLDVHLHHTNGLEILNQIRKNPKMDRLKIIMTSGQDYSEQSKLSGADSFLMKPYMPEELISLLKH